MGIWSDEFYGAVTVCDSEGVIIFIHQHANRQFLKNGGKDLPGTNLPDCHPEPARSRLVPMFKTPTINTNTVEKDVMYYPLRIPKKRQKSVLKILNFLFK